MNKLVFVGGSGRSGTHLLGRTLSSHPDFVGRIEDPSSFNLITRIASTQDISYEIINKYRRYLLNKRLSKVVRDSNSHILEKSHPSIWLVSHLVKNLQEVKFILVYRDAEGTVNSMLKHKGVLAWYDLLPQNKVNRFLGITKENQLDYPKYSLTQKCTCRWASHYLEILRLVSTYPESTLSIKYEDYIRNPELFQEKIAVFLNVSNLFTAENVNLQSLDKWKFDLNKAQLTEIQEIKKAFGLY